MSHAVRPEQLLVLFHQAAHLAMRELYRNGSHTQGRILGILAEQGNLGQKALRGHLGIRAPSLSELLGKLDKNGFIVRRCNSTDKRSIVIEITDKGRAAASEAQTELQNSIAGLFAVLDETEQVNLAALLSKLITSWSASTAKTTESPCADPMKDVRREE
ncbi:MarR family transcriptional regulator [uncultured Bilophila sp.]|uniref:MarR family winged helix-turn-helix transcriptional regulator n=1 Tax=uncultured Bilophila sp. TaxID=529385 RepID=UPI00280B4ED1|nr:MarR family transcriptional regulator [uncultured Bilophila sp.]